MITKYVVMVGDRFARKISYGNFYLTDDASNASLYTKLNDANDRKDKVIDTITRFEGQLIDEPVCIKLVEIEYTLKDLE